MGGVSSVYIRPVASSSTENIEEVEATTNETSDTNDLVQWRMAATDPGGSMSGGVLELRLPPEGDREAALGRTIQFLAEENVRLRNKNSLLKTQLNQEKLPVLVQPDLLDETPDQKIARLEKTLAEERQEKWDAIENSEKRRVELVNCQRDLEHAFSSQMEVQTQLAKSKKQIQELTEVIEQRKIELRTSISNGPKKLEAESESSEIDECCGQRGSEISKNENVMLEKVDFQDQENKTTENSLPGGSEVIGNDAETAISADNIDSSSLEAQGRGLSDLVPRDGTDLQTFRSQILQLREARQKVIFAKAQEMSQLREELKNEKTIRERLEIQLERATSRHTSGEGPSETVILNQNLTELIERLQIDIEQANVVKEENKELIKTVQTLRNEVSLLNTKLLHQQNDFSELLRKNERLLRDQDVVIKEKTNCEEKIKEIEEEQKKMWEEYDNEKREIGKRTAALKEVVDITRQMLLIRERQVTDLKAKLKDLEESVAEKNRLEGSELKVEYEKQLENIKKLKELYEERVQLMEAEKVKLAEKITDKTKEIDDLKTELNDLTLKYEMAGEEVDTEKQKNLALSNELSSSQLQARSYQRELTAMNSLLTQMLLGPNLDMDLDRLTEQLQQNHALIAQITTCEDCSDVADALPKLLLDLIAQVEEREKKEPVAIPHRPPDPMTDSTDTISEQSEALIADTAGAVLPVVSYKNATVFKQTLPVEEQATTAVRQAVPVNEQTTTISQAPELGDVNCLEVEDGMNNTDPAVQEIVTNLPKVWKVLTELLSHHSVPETTPTNEERTCYKIVDTPNGPRSVISVSNTFIHLKELILEKKSLMREVYRLKHLNTHLETRLDDQEKRLSTVQSELHKTWGVVGRMRAQHQQLHNHEKILRYELQEKRVMLTELKQELEYCRDKWERARRKNNESETEVRKLRKEFAARKIRDANYGLGRDSGESGFSDEHNDSSDDADRSSTPSPVDFVDLQTVIQVVEEVERDARLCNLDISTNESGVVNVAYDAVAELNIRDNPSESGGEDPGPQLPGNEIATVVEDLPVCNLELENTASVIPVVEESCVVVQNLVPSNKEACCSGGEIEAAGSSSAVTVASGEAKQDVIKESAVPVKNVESKSSESELSVQSTVETVAEQRTEDERERAREARANRLQRLEEQCRLLVRKVDITTHKSNYLNNRLEELHDHYGEKESTSEQNPTTEASSSQDVDRCSANSSVSAQPLQDEACGACPIISGEKDEQTIPQIRPPTPPPLPKSLENHSERSQQKLKSEAPIPPPLPSTLLSEIPPSPKETVAKAFVTSSSTTTKSTPSTSSSSAPERDTSLATFDARMAERAARLKQLEEQCSSLFGKVSNTVERSNELSARLEEIHEECVIADNRREERSTQSANNERLNDEEASSSLALATDLNITNETASAVVDESTDSSPEEADNKTSSTQNSSP